MSKRSMLFPVIIAILLFFAVGFVAFSNQNAAAGNTSISESTHTIESTTAAGEPMPTTVIKLQIGSSIMSVNGQEQSIDESGTVPIIQNSRTLLPVRAVVEAMGGVVTWDGQSETVTLTRSGDVIILTIGNQTANLNESAHTLDAAPVIIGTRTMLPIRFIAESFGFDVS